MPATHAAANANSHPPARERGNAHSSVHVQSLQEAADTMINEARMVLPGVQALFGFQLIAVFSERFASISQWLQGLHLLATVLVALVVALIMAPAAYHRIAERGRISRRFVDVGSWVISAAMALLAVAIALELYLLVRVVAGSNGIALLVGASMLVALMVAWVLVPALHRYNNHQ